VGIDARIVRRVGHRRDWVLDSGEEKSMETRPEKVLRRHRGGEMSSVEPVEQRCEAARSCPLQRHLRADHSMDCRCPSKGGDRASPRLHLAREHRAQCFSSPDDRITSRQPWYWPAGDQAKEEVDVTDKRCAAVLRGGLAAIIIRLHMNVQVLMAGWQ